jgi:hypothetical protein
MLRTYIRKLILEAMKDPTVHQNDLGLWTDWGSPTKLSFSHNFVLYDLNEARANLMSHWSPDGSHPWRLLRYAYDSSIDPVVAVMEISKPRQPCHGGWEVRYSAARGDYGPTLYDLVMSVSPGGLFSDRNSVSGEAANVWKFYGNKRKDVKRGVMDGANLTPLNPDDDCETADPYNTLFGAASRNRVEDFLKKKGARDWSEFKRLNPRDIDGIPIENSHEDNIFTTYKEWSANPQGEAGLDNDWQTWQQRNPLGKYIDFELTRPGYLDIVYNTNYATQPFKKMVQNHNNLIKEVTELHGTFPANFDASIDRVVETFFDEYF